MPGILSTILGNISGTKAGERMREHKAKLQEEMDTHRAGLDVYGRMVDTMMQHPELFPTPEHQEAVMSPFLDLMPDAYKKSAKALFEQWQNRQEGKKTLQDLTTSDRAPMEPPTDGPQPNGGLQTVTGAKSPPAPLVAPPGASGSFPGMGGAMQQFQSSLPAPPPGPPPPSPVTQSAQAGTSGFDQPMMEPSVDMHPQGFFATPVQQAHAQEPVFNLRVGQARQIGLRDPAQVADYLGGRPVTNPTAVQEFESAQIMRRVDQMKSNGDWDKMSPRQRAEVLIGAKQVTPELRPQALAGTVSGAEAPQGQMDTNGHPITATSQYRIRVLPDGEKEWNPIVATTGHVVMPSDKSPTGWSRVEVDRLGNKVGELLGVPPPAAYAPVVMNGKTYHMADFGDHKELIPITSTSTRQRVVPGQSTGPDSLPPPPGKPAPTGGTPKPASAPVQGAGAEPATSGIRGAVNLGPKNLPPYQSMTARGKIKALDNTMDIAERLEDNIGVLNSMLSAAKVDFAIEPNQGMIHGFITRNMRMTPKEIDVARDFGSLMEHINTLRGPLGATGFRGHEAWGALQAQRGQILSNPEITRGILENTLKALSDQRSNLADAAKVPQRPLRQLTPTPNNNEKVEPIPLKSGGFLNPHDKKAADDFRREHSDLIKK